MFTGPSPRRGKIGRPRSSLAVSTTCFLPWYRRQTSWPPLQSWASKWLPLVEPSGHLSVRWAHCGVPCGRHLCHRRALRSCEIPAVPNVRRAAKGQTTAAASPIFRPIDRTVMIVIQRAMVCLRSYSMVSKSQTLWVPPGTFRKLIIRAGVALSRQRGRHLTKTVPMHKRLKIQPGLS